MTRKRTAPTEFIQPYRYPSPNIPLSAIRRYARQIAERFRPEKIILFGSYAYGTPHNESDVDLMVIMPAWNVTSKAIQIDNAFDRWFSLDLLVRTPKQIAQAFKDNNWFLREVVEKGIVLYEAPNREVGSQGGGRLAKRAAARRRKPAAARSGVLRLSTTGRKVPQGTPAKSRRGRAENV